MKFINAAGDTAGKCITYRISVVEREKRWQFESLILEGTITFKLTLTVGCEGMYRKQLAFGSTQIPGTS